MVTCPAGQQSLSWLPNTYPQSGMVWEVRVPDAQAGPVKALVEAVRNS